MHSDSIEFLDKLVGFDTVSSKSNLDLIEFVGDLLCRNGIEPTIIHSEEGDKANLFANIGPAGRGGVMLSGHTDVVPVDGQDWTKPAFQLTNEGTRLFGRGTADMKGFVACALAMFVRATKKELRTPLHLALSYDEEIGCVGVHSLMDMLSMAPAQPAMCIVGEPTGMGVATGHKGKTALKATCVGLEGHSALAPFALNALHLGVDFINILRDMQKEIAAGTILDSDYDVPYTTLHAGMVQGGVALNIVPNLCEIRFEIRNIAQDDPEVILTELRRRVEVLNTEARKTVTTAGISMEITNSYPGLDTPIDSDVVRFVKSLTGANATAKVAFGTEGGLFSRTLGIPTVICGPGSMSQGHKPDEFIEMEQIERCDIMMESLLQRLVEGV